MATITELLEALNTKAAAVSTATLATELGASVKATLTQLKREKEKGTVSGSSEEGWLIIDKGKKALEEGIHPSMIDEGVTPRQQFEAKGQLIGIKEDRIRLATDIVWSGDYTDIKWVWEALGQADIADDLRGVWVNAWRAKLHKGIPPDLAAELTGAAKPAAGEAQTTEIGTKVPSRDFIIDEDIPVRVGAGLGDYSLADAKDILSIRALKSRLGGTGQAGDTQPSATEKVSEILTALSPYINKGTDLTALKETLAAQLAQQKQEIMSHIPQPVQASQPKSLLEQLTELKALGPMLKSILGIPETTANPFTPAQVIGLDGQPSVMDLTKVLDLRKFLSEEKRADERHSAVMGLVQTVRENIPDGIAALREAAAEVKGGSKTAAQAETQAPTEQVYECGSCHAQFKVPPGEWQNVGCPNCKTQYTREQVMKA